MGNCLSQQTVDKSNEANMLQEDTKKGQKNAGGNIKSSILQIQLDDATPGVKDIFSLFSCPIQNNNIVEKTCQLAKTTNKLTTKTSHSKWKKVSYNYIKQKNGVLWGLCNWKNQKDNAISGRAYLYFYEKKDQSGEGQIKPNQFLVAGIFANGKINQLENHYKIMGNGSYYFGKLNKELLPQGQGEFNYINNDFYKGNFVNGIPNGQGELRTSQKSFKGTFKNGQKIKGEQVGQKGKYVGSFKDNMRHGKGILTMNDGIIYEGNFEKNKRHGQGKLIGKDGKVVYSGQWVMDRRQEK